MRLALALLFCALPLAAASVSGVVINRTTGDLVTGVSFSLGASTAIVQEQTFTIALLSEPVINL